MLIKEDFLPLPCNVERVSLTYLYKTKELTSEEKLIAERITALCRQKGYSWISNKSLADMYGIREDTVSKHIKKFSCFLLI